MELYVGRPNIPDIDDFLNIAKSILENKRLTNNGPLVREFEAELSKHLGVEHVVTVCNATIGLIVAIKALRLSGEVILPSFTFIASTHALQWAGIKPVFCDIDPATHNINPAEIERLITDHTSAIMGVHIWGRSCAHDEILKISHKQGLKLIYDSAHAFGTTYKSQPIAALGDASVLSFHATKSFNTFEGGAIVTNDHNLAERARLLCNFSFEGEDNVTGLGINAKMAEINAAMGLCNLKKIPEVLSHNKKVYDYYKEKLSKIKGISLIDYPENEINNYHYIITEVDEREFGHSRDAIHGLLKSQGIFARKYFNPGCHKSQPYRTIYSDIHLPHTDNLCKRVLALPGGSGIDDFSDIDNIIQLICRLL